MNLGSHAHSPDLSSLVLSKTTDGKYVMQITSSLTAFEGEVDYLFGKDSYKTPDDFRDLVIKHFRKNVSFLINGKSLEFVNPEVILGHETKLVAEVKDVPGNINTIDLKNSMFKDMSRNETVVMMIGEDFPNRQYTLNNKNSQHIALEAKNRIWSNIDSTGFKLKAKNIYLLVLLALAIPFVYFLARRKKEESIKLA